VSESEYLEQPGDLLRWECGSEPFCFTWVLSPDAPHMLIDDINYAPTVSGVYALSDEDGMLLYIGKSLSIQTRMAQHYWAMTLRHGKRFARFSWLEVPPFALQGVEVAHIHALLPPLNILLESPVWAGHKALTQRVSDVWESAYEN
jgi:hypothetical protein